MCNNTYQNLQKEGIKARSKNRSKKLRIYVKKRERIPSFANRSNVLSHQYQLNSKKHHQYQPIDHPEKHHHSSQRKYYYQLNSKRHHHYQPDPKMYDAQPLGKDLELCDQNNKNKESSLHYSQYVDFGVCFNNNYGNALNGVGGSSSVNTSSPAEQMPVNGFGVKSSVEDCVAVDSGNRLEPCNGERTCKVLKEKQEHWKKRVESKIRAANDYGNKITFPIVGLVSDKPLTTEKDIPSSNECKFAVNGYSKERVYTNSGKRCLSEISELNRSCKKILTSQSVSASDSLKNQCLQNFPLSPQQPDIIHIDSDLDEPIDLRCVKSRCDSDQGLGNNVVQVTPKELQPTEKHEEPQSLFRQFFGNIVITDVTANCLTVTFKEYITT
ncbi:E3 SUMO-protein ligase CBX4 [Hyla sarda]|uniref:E3 SUMO-protein ligase CBX4 n=1 Tax=Hyla sarda TaxID=327740 RepID=UPI0024C291B1|nr:E3 SUMO-protein ligase CBX4 [Hyla sarda]